MPINQRGSSWQAAVTHKGTRLRKDFENEKDAQAWHDQTLAAMKAGLIGKVEEPKEVIPTLSEMRDKVHTLRWAGTRGGDTSMTNLRHVIDILGPDRLVSSLTKHDVLTLKTEFKKWGVSDATINRKLCALSTMMYEAVEFGYLDKVFKVGLTKEMNGRVRTFTNDEEASMLTWCDQNGAALLRDYIVVSMDTGFRQGEVLRIIADDVGDDNLWTYDTKNGESREVPLTARCKAALTARAKGQGGKALLFNIAPKVLREGDWRKMQKALGFADDDEFTPHVMRHTWVTRLLGAGVDIKTVQEMAGHKNITTTQRYAKTSPERKATAIRRLEGFQSA